jgi:type II secretory pathway pseudopilin PulG
MKANFTKRRSEQGYVLLTLMLMVTIMVIMAAAIAPEITFQVRRDREEELIHRGVQYSRAIRRYVKKFGRYPTRIEDLENTNNVRFLRRRYKDPITGKDFKLLHVGEVQLTPGAGLAGATPVSSMPGATLGQQPAAPAQPQPNATDPNQANATQADEQSQSAGSDNLTGQVFGGGPIVGVASTSKKETIREFNHKNHYNQWQFIYDPSTDRGGLLNTPAQPPLQGAAPQVQQQQPGAPGAVPQPPTEAAPQNPQPQQQ